MDLQYVEQSEIRRYIGRWYNHLFTEAERNGPTAEWLRNQVTDASSDEINVLINEQYDSQEQRPIVLQLLTAIDQFTDKSIGRILREHADEIVLVRCPNCSNIVASPDAQQCLWCGNDWHQSSNTSLNEKGTE